MSKEKAKGKIDAQLKDKREQFTSNSNKGKSKFLYATIGLVAVLVVATIFMFTGSNKTPGSIQPTPEEAKYIGRYLPAGFKQVELMEPYKYDRTVEMTRVEPVVKDGKITLKAGEIINARIVYFEYTRPSDNQAISMMAYIKPSGKLFTGVSYCPPCQGKYHHFEADGTLTCNSCGTKRDPESEAGISGPCKLYPADEMAHKQVGDTIQIAEADLAKWQSQPLDRPVGAE